MSEGAVVKQSLTTASDGKRYRTNLYNLKAILAVGRASEKRFYQKIRDLFAQTSSDYDKGSDTAKTFFATIQNKLVFAVTG